MSIQTVIDSLFGAEGTRLSWRSLLAWLVIVGLFVYGLVDQTALLTVTGLFIGKEAIGKFAAKRGA